MSKRETTILKGIAILMMLFFHLFLREEIIELCHPLIYLGDRPLVYYFAQACYPVTFYMILSGYGLTYLYNQGMLSLKKQTKRLFKLYIHYWLVLIIFVSIAYFIRPNLYKYDLLHIIGNITAIRCNYNGEVWFLFPYASISLTSFPIIHYVYQLKDKNKIFFTIVIYVLIFLTSKWLLLNLSENLVINIIETQFAYYVNLIFYFILGIILFRFIETGYILQFRKNYLYAIMLIVLVSLKSLFKITIIDGLYAFLFIMLFLKLRLPSIVSTILYRLGQRSMVIWMTHTFYCAYLFPQFIYGFNYPILIFIVLVVVCYLTAIPIMFLANIIINKCKI